jgi:hypothetical protein
MNRPDGAPLIGLGILLADTTKGVGHTIGLLTEMMGLSGRRSCMFFGNWDDDPRELYDIPEVQEWCQEFVEAGGLSLLDRPQDLPAGLHTLPSQYLVVACAGLPGAERVGPLHFRYNPRRIEQLEREYCS